MTWILMTVNSTSQDLKEWDFKTTKNSGMLTWDKMISNWLKNNTSEFLINYQLDVFERPLSLLQINMDSLNFQWNIGALFNIVS